MVAITLYAKQKKRHRCIEQTFWTLWEKVRVWCSERTALKQVYYQWWNRPPAQVGCMRQVFGPGALGRPRGMGWGERQEGGSGWGIHVNPWLIHVNVWQKPLQYCKVISLQLIKINEKKKIKSYLFVQRIMGGSWCPENIWSHWDEKDGLEPVLKGVMEELKHKVRIGYSNSMLSTDIYFRMFTRTAQIQKY